MTSGDAHNDILMNLSDEAVRKMEAPETANGVLDTNGWLTVAQVAQRLNVAERTVQRRCEKKKLHARRVTTADGVAWRINPEGLPTGADKSRHTADILPTFQMILIVVPTHYRQVPTYL